MQPLDEQSGNQNSLSRWQRLRMTIRRTLGMALVAGILLLFSRGVIPAPCWAVFALAGLIAWPIWQYRTEYLLFRRRLVLSGAARPESRIRRFLWKGGATRAVQVVVSLFLAWILLVLVSRLSDLHWYVLAVDTVFLSLIAGPVTRQLAGDIKARHLGVVARRWPLFLINGIVLSAAIMAVDFYIIGAEDTRHMVWHQVAEQAFAESYGASGCVLWGVSAGGVAAVEALSWHLSELVIPNLPDVSVMIIAWSFFLLRAVAVAWLFTALLLGASVFLDKRAERRAGRAAESAFSRSFFMTIIILAIPFLYASVKLGKVDLPAIEEGVGRVADMVNPCKPNAASRAGLVMKLDKVVASEREKVMADVDSSVDQGLEQIFSDVEAGVDGYLDWYFTVVGEYQRLAVVFTADVTSAMSEKLEQYLFTQSDFGTQLDQLDGKVGGIGAERFAGMVPSLGAELDNLPCDIGRIDLTPLFELDRDSLRASTAVTGGVGTGIVASKVLAKKTAAAVAGKVAAKKSFQAGAALASKTLAKKGTSAALSAGLGTTLCAPAGPGAILCGVAAGLVTWLTVDKTLVEIDEALNREAMRADILDVLAGQQAELGIQLKQKHHDRVERLAARVNDAVERTFIPYRDGMGP
jgi:hypothetical protein